MHRKWGTSGYLGVHVGGLEYGHRADGAIVRLSGPTAKRWFRRFVYVATNVSRIDLQWTMVYEEEPHVVIETQFDLMRKLWSTKKRWPEPKLILGPNGGESIKSGNRQSDVFLRAYHRGARKGFEHAAGHIRYEVEFKNGAARSIAQSLMPHRTASSRIEAQCLTRFRNRGCALPISDNVPHLYRCTRNPGDVHRSLEWLRGSVQSTVQRLVNLGYEAEVLDALGLNRASTRS